MDERLAQLLDTAGEHRASVAACAILLELARSDGHTDATEIVAVQRTLLDRLGLDTDAARSVQWLAQRARHLHPDDPMPFAAEVRAAWPVQARRQVLAAMRDVVWADAQIDLREARLVVSVGEALGLSRDEVRAVWRRPTDG